MPLFSGEKNKRGYSGRYPVIGLVASIYTWLAVVVGIIAFAGVVLGIAALRADPLQGILSIVLSLVGGVLLAVTLFAASEVLRLLVDIEENLRRSSQFNQDLSSGLKRARTMAGIKKKFGEMLQESLENGDE